MPAIDGFVFVAPHPGQGVLLMGAIDPSVKDERDPLSVDSSLDALDAANGFAEPTASAKYSPQFLERYRAGQRARVARLDAAARDLIAARMDARRKAKDGGSEQLRRLGAHTPIMRRGRMDADPRCFDLSIDPSIGHTARFGAGTRVFEMTAQSALRRQLHAGSLALDLVGPELHKCGAGEDGAVDWAAELAG